MRLELRDAAFKRRDLFLDVALNDLDHFLAEFRTVLKLRVHASPLFFKIADHVRNRRQVGIIIERTTDRPIVQH